MSLPLSQRHPKSILARLRALLAPVPRMAASRSVVLVYHGVTAKRPLQLNSRFVSARRLQQDIRALKQIPGLRFVPLADALDPDCPGPKIALTFDDGYRSMHHTLLPVLEAEKVPACLFITTLDAHPPAKAHRRMLWADRIDVAAHLGHAPLEIGDETFRLDSRRNWRRDGDGMMLKKLCVERNVAFLDAVAAVCDPGEDLGPYWELLSPDELRVLAAHPLISLGAHGITHANFPSISQSERWREMTGSKAWLEETVQQPVTAFAYPHGCYTQACLEEVRRAGYAIQALLEYESETEERANDLCARIGIHPLCGSRVQRRVIAAGGYGRERLT